MSAASASRTLIVGTAVGIFFVTGVLPLVYLVGTTIADVPLHAVALDARQRMLLWNSVVLASAAAVQATLLGAPLGFALGRVPIARRASVRIALAAPVVLPPYIVALAWTYVGGSTGVLATLIGRELASNWTYSLPAASAVLALVYYPIAMLATEAALRQVDPRLEEAGVIAARPAHVLRRITFPLVAPAVGAAALIVFVLAISEFGVPALLRVRVYTTEVFTAFAALFDFGRATALTLPLVAVAAGTSTAAALLFGARVVAGRRLSAGLGVDVAAWRPPLYVLVAATIFIALVIPITVLLVESGDLLDASRGAWPSIRVSLLLATVGATLVVAVGGVLGYARARTAGRKGRAVDVVWIVLFAVPSTIVGVALIALWNRSGVMGAVYGTTAMLILVYLARFVPVAALIVAASVRQVPDSHEEAAAVAGASWLRTVWGVVLPQVSRGMAAAWVIAFVFAFGELGASILVSPPGESTLPIRIYTIIANTPSTVVAALAVLQIAVVGIPLAAAALYAARRTT